jgi:HEAT repeat protein
MCMLAWNGDLPTQAIPAVVAVLVVIAALAVMFAYIVARRLWRARRFRRLDRYRHHWLERLPDLLAGEIPAQQELAPESRDILEHILIDRLQVASGDNQELLSVVIERTGLLDRRIQMLRSGKRWLRLRSAALLGQMRAPAAVGALVEALESRWRPLRTTAVRSLGMIGSPAAFAPLLRALLAQDRELPADPHVWLDAAVACCRDARGFLPLLLDGRPDRRAMAARAIGECRDTPSARILAGYVFDPDPEVRAQIVRALGRIREHSARDLLIAAVSDPVWFVRLRAVAALAEHAAPETLPAVLAATRDPDFRVRQRAAATLAILAAQPEEILAELMGGGDRYALEGFLSELGRAGLLWRAIPLLCATERATRRRAEELLARAAAAGSCAELLHAVEAHPDHAVSRAAARTLLEHAGPDLAPELRRRLRVIPSARVGRLLRVILRRLETLPAERAPGPDRVPDDQVAHPV